MTSQQLAAFLSIGLAVCSVWVTVFFGLPAVARSRYQYDVTVIRHRFADDILDGVLPNEPATMAFLQLAEGSLLNAHEFTLSRALSIHWALNELHCEMEERSPSFRSLSPEQRKLLHQYQEELFKAGGRLLVHGSHFGWLMILIQHVMRRVPRRRRPGVVASANPTHLAQEYASVSTRRTPEALRLASAR